MPKKPSKPERAQSRFHEAAQTAGLTPQAGKKAIKGEYRTSVDSTAGYAFTASVDLDGHFSAPEGTARRWDYGVGLRDAKGGELALWVEPHSAASTSEASVMIEKLQWLKGKLDAKAFRDLRALRDEAAAHTDWPYRWLVPEGGAIKITALSKEAKRLAAEGLDQPRRRLVLP